MYLRIPTPQEVSAAYCNLQEAAERLGLDSGYNLQFKLRQQGIQIVRLCGKPMVYRHEVEKLRKETV